MALIRSALSCYFSTASSGGGSFMLHTQLSPQQLHKYGGHTALGAKQSHPLPLPSLHGRERSAFPGSIPPDDTVNSRFVVGISPGDSGVVLRYPIDDFTCAWSVEYFVGQSHHLPFLYGQSVSTNPLPT